MSVRHIEDKDLPELQAKLKEIGFEQTAFEPKVNQRFIATVEGLPSHVIKAVELPQRHPDNWTSVGLFLYNPLGSKIEQAAIDLVKKDHVQITVKILDPAGNVDTIWEILTTTNGAEAYFGSYDWSDTGEANEISIRFDVDDVRITYPENA